MNLKIFKMRQVSDVIYLLMLLAVFNVFSKGTYIVLATTVFMIVYYGRFKIDKTFLVLLAFSVSYMSTDLLTGYSPSIVSSLRVFVFPCAYLIGYCLSWRKKKLDIKNVILDVAIFMSSHLILNLFYNIRRLGGNIFSNSLFYDVFSGNISAATGQVTYAACLCSCLSYILLFRKKSIRKVIVLLFYILISIYNIALGGRTYFVLLIASFIVGLYIYFLKTDKKSRIIKYILGVGVLIVIASIFYQSNFAGVQDSVEKSYFYRRFFAEGAHRQDLTEDSRISIKIEYIKHMLDYPIGGGHIYDKVGQYAHELWLDIYNVGGIIPYVLIITYSISALIRFIKYVRRKNVELEEKILLTCFVVILFMEFFLEPILNGAPMLLVAFCYIDGILSKMLKCAKTEKIGRLLHVKFGGNQEYRV